MTPEDRALLLSLRRQQADIQESLDKLNTQLSALEARDVAPEPFPPLPPLPVEPELPPLPVMAETALPSLPPLPDAVISNLPPIPTPPVRMVPKPSLEFQFGRWLIRITPVLGVITLAFILSWPKVQAVLGTGGLLGLSAMISMIVVVAGLRLERKNSRFFGRTIVAMALAWLYLTVYAAGNYEKLRIIHSPLIAGLVLLLWSIYVFLLAERKKSQALSLFAITLAYFSSAINPVNSFTMAADLLLALTAVVFLIRNGWAALSYFSLLGTYLVLLRRLIIDENGELILDTSRTLHFWPYAIYLSGAWLIFTAAVIFSTAPTFRGGKRLIFLSLNNGALAGLLVLTAYIAGYGYGEMGWTLLDSGLALLLTSRIAAWTRIEPKKLMRAYVAQGWALVTAGIMVVYTGVTRGVLLMLETFFLGAAAALSRSPVLIGSTYVAGFFATLFLIWEIAVNAHHPWLLGCGGAAVMLLNAWWARSGVDSKARDLIVPDASYYSALALGLIFTAMYTALNDSTVPPALALVALAFTFSVYLVPLFELPPVAQTFLLVAQTLVIFPVETGEELPWWSTAGVAAVTLVITTWWSRQRVTRVGPWTVALNFVYALALVGLAYQTVRPYVDPQGWMIGASLISILFLIYGAFARVWPIAAMGQLFLLVAIHHFFVPPGTGNIFPWTWWAAAVPMVVVFSTARATHEWLRLFPEIPEWWRNPLRLLAYGYQLLALAMLVRLVFALVSPLHQIAVFFFLGTLILSLSVRHRSTFGIRCSFVLSVLGMILYIENLGTHAHAMATVLNGLALLAFLAQSALLRHEGSSLVTRLESWAVILFSTGTGWIFVSAWVLTRPSPGYLTMSWAIYALFLFIFGLLVRERRHRWCGLAILLAAIIRVFCADFWGLSSGYRVLTFVILTLITLGLGYLIIRFADTRKSWL